MNAVSSTLSRGLYSMKDEQFLLYRATDGRKSDAFEAKSWLITAKAIFPEKFGVQFQIYKIAKDEKNIKDAAKCLESLFLIFKDEPLMWAEVDAIMLALCDTSSLTSNSILSQIFYNLSKETQKMFVTCASERSKDTMTYCSLMLLLTSTFPESTAYNGLKLVDALIKAEKPNQSPLNPFRRKLVCELIPRLLKAEGLEVRPKILHQLLIKSIEFYVAYATTPPRVAHVTLENETTIDDPWKELFSVIRMIGWNLGWELANEFDNVKNREAIFTRIQSMVESGARLGGPKGDNGEDVREVLFTTVTIFLHALMDYTRKLYPDFMQGDLVSYYPPPLTLVEAFVKREPTRTPTSPMSPPLKRLRHSFSEETSSPLITVSTIDSSNGIGSSNIGDLVLPSVGGTSSRGSHLNLSSRALSQALITAIKCWDLLHSYEQVRAEFVRLLEGLGIERWLIVFNIDVLIYEGRFPDADRQIRHTLSRANSNPVGCPPITMLTLNLKLASILFGLNKFSAAATVAVEIIDKLTPLSGLGGLTPSLVCPTSLIPAPPMSPLHSHPQEPSHKRHLHLLALTRPQCLQFVCTLLIQALRHLIIVERSGDDLCIGHLIVLLQYEWPRYDTIFDEVIVVIRQKGGFAYQFFAPYVTTPDILEEFMFLSSGLGGRLQMDIVPLTHSKNRISTRGADRDSKQDFKHAMKRQMLRSCEPIEPNIIRFLNCQGPYISHVFM